MKPAIEVNHLTKEYRLGALRSLRQAATDAGRKLLGQPVPQRERFLALDDVSFTVQPGEVVGVIGHNGAGKSTLLKMISRITTPTSGSVTVNGRIAPLIEVGAGFVGDMTGRENVYLNGAILGLKKKEIDRKFDEIVAFAEMERFIDTPVKRYSSGMQVKLAFAVATSIESEILIVDEVLAVGDLAFQRKCFDRMEELINRQGRTVLLVTHNIRQVERLCTRALLLELGSLVADDSAIAIAEAYYTSTNDKNAARHLPLDLSQASDEFELLSCELVDASGAPIRDLGIKDNLTIDIRFRVKSHLRAPTIGLGIHTTDFLRILTVNTETTSPMPDFLPGEHLVRCRIGHLPLAPASYQLRLGVTSGAAARAIYYREGVNTFRVSAESIGFRLGTAGREGFIVAKAEWATPGVESGLVTGSPVPAELR